MSVEFLLPAAVTIRRRRLPHWEVRNGSYFVTIRCADSLPRLALLRVQEIHRRLRCIPAADPALICEQRRLFALLERYLDAGHGTCPLADAKVAGLVVNELKALEEIGYDTPHFTIMPNHLHAVICPAAPTVAPLAFAIKRFKGRSAFQSRKVIGGKGRFWQEECFDRWIRDPGEFERFRRYISANPIKAGLPRSAVAYSYTQ
jgi:putative transposase